MHEGYGSSREVSENLHRLPLNLQRLAHELLLGLRQLLHRLGQQLQGARHRLQQDVGGVLLLDAEGRVAQDGFLRFLRGQRGS